MPVYAKVKKLLAQKAKEKLTISPDYPVKKQGEFVYFPVQKKIKGFTYVTLKAKKNKKRPQSLRQALQKTLSKQELACLSKSFDTIGQIAVIEISHSLEKKKKIIGEALLQVHPNLKTVCMKASVHKGVFRVMQVKIIAGKKQLTTIHKESGVKLKVHVGKVYFSPRLSTERDRIACLVKPGETIAGFFAGVGPFPLTIAKKKKCKVYAIELNPVGVKMIKENIKLNLLKGEVIPILGDVRQVAKKMEKCDRVLMPLPKGSEDFLDCAFEVAKPHAIVHFYQFAPDSDLFSDAVKKIRAVAAKAGRKVKIKEKKWVRSHAPRISQVVIDFEVI